MNVSPVRISARAARIHKRVEALTNSLVRGADTVLGKLRLGGRKAAYDDVTYQFDGGEATGLRKKHYDKSLRLLWKAEDKSPWLDFRDMTNDEKALREMALRDLSEEERDERVRMGTKEFREMLNRTYTPKQKPELD